MSVKYRVISIGTLSRNALWNEKSKKRNAHATTTLIQDGDTTVLVDPSLPAEILQQRLDERSGLTIDQIDVVFLTTFRPIHRRSLALFDRATWLMDKREIEAMNLHLDQIEGQTEMNESDPDVDRLVEEERSLLARIAAAGDKLTQQVHLFPSPGVTPGSAALLLALATRTIVIAGDAVVTQDHAEAGRVYEQVFNLDQAQESLSEIIEIADVIVPGHDNVFFSGSR
jgi:glyoxylase-like metal-dependent hydrolase (beta-lactamase superfamily II)